jgi:chromosome segregation ATPase
MSGRVNESEQRGTAEAVKGRSLDDVERDVARAVEELHSLKAERESLPESVEAATAGLDAVKLEELGQREHSLRAQVEAAQGRLWQLYAERARMQLPEAEAKAEEAQAEYGRAHAEYLQAHERTNRLGVEANNTMMAALRLRQTIEENERRVKETMRRLPTSLRASLVGPTETRLPR